MKFKKILGIGEIILALIVAIVGQGIAFFVNTLEGDPFEINLFLAGFLMLFLLFEGINHLVEK